MSRQIAWALLAAVVLGATLLALAAGTLPARAVANLAPTDVTTLGLFSLKTPRCTSLCFPFPLTACAQQWQQERMLWILRGLGYRVEQIEADSIVRAAREVLSERRLAVG